MDYSMVSKLQLRFNTSGSDEHKKIKAVSFSYINEQASDEALQDAAKSLSTLYMYPLVEAVRNNAVTLPN